MAEFDSHPMGFNGLVLAGGQSSRMGQDKALLRCANGETLVQRATSLLRHMGAQQVFISSHNPQIAHRLSDIYPHRGPVSGIHAALTQASKVPLLVLPVDMPLMQPTMLQSLLDVGLSEKTSCCYAHQCLPLFIVDAQKALSCAEMLLSGDANVSVWRFIKAINAKELETDAEQAFKNANDPQQWQECQALMQS